MLLYVVESILLSVRLVCTVRPRELQEPDPSNWRINDKNKHDADDAARSLAL